MFALIIWGSPYGAWIFLVGGFYKQAAPTGAFQIFHVKIFRYLALPSKGYLFVTHYYVGSPYRDISIST